MSATLADGDRASDKSHGDAEKINEKEAGTRTASPVVQDYHHEAAGGKVPFAVYLEQAELTRAHERETGGHDDTPGLRQKDDGTTILTAHEEELLNARRALRVASWASVFYLITTDILGPFNAPFAFSQVGYAPGAILYLVMGVAACYTGLLLWHLFIRLDSNRYPVRTYADLAERIFGRWAKYGCSVLQSLQLIINVGTICLSNGQAVEQIAGNHQFCFSVCILIWTFVGMFIGQIRTLKNYGWLANSAVWLNLLIIFISMGFISHSPPNIAAAQAAYGPSIGDGPVVKSAFVSQPLFSKVNGIMNMVFAYGGAMIFPEFMAEMRRPMDFWKGMVCAQLLISTVYLMYGLFVYSFQGQYTLPLAYQGVSKQSWQDVGNVISLITGVIAAGLYGNIGIKVAYINLVEEWAKGPSLLSRKGHVIWSGMVLVYWALAYIIASAIPQVQTISGLVAAICIMQFTYTFPPLFILGYQMILDAGGPNDPGDTWADFSRWRRGFWTDMGGVEGVDGEGWVAGGVGKREVWKKRGWKCFNLVLFLGAASMACLGMYGSGMSIKNTFASGAAATSFGCKSPVG